MVFSVTPCDAAHTEGLGFMFLNFGICPGLNWFYL